MVPYKFPAHDFSTLSQMHMHIQDCNIRERIRAVYILLALSSSMQTRTEDQDFALRLVYVRLKVMWSQVRVQLAHPFLLQALRLQHNPCNEQHRRI